MNHFEQKSFAHLLYRFSILLFIILLMLLNIYQLSKADYIIVDGVERTYELYAPSDIDYSKTVHILIVLHGGGGQGKGMIKLTGFNDEADKNKFIVVYPDGINKHWNDGREVNVTLKDGKVFNDVQFISQLIDTVKTKYQIENSKIFVTGISNGGFMCFSLACDMLDKIKAIAVVAASMTIEQINYCRPSSPVPVMIIFGDQDPLVPFEGGDVGFKLFKKKGKVIPVDQTVNFWVKNNECNSDPVITTVDSSSDEDTKAVNYLYSGGKNNSSVNYWLIKGGGHTWPGGYQYLPKVIVGSTSRQIKASEKIWKFFSSLKN